MCLVCELFIFIQTIKYALWVHSTSPWMEIIARVFLLMLPYHRFGWCLYSNKKKLILLLSSFIMLLNKDKYLRFEVNLRSIVLNTEKYTKPCEKDNRKIKKSLFTIKVVIFFLVYYKKSHFYKREIYVRKKFWKNIETSLLSI